VSAEIIQFIPRPGRDDAPTDFPTIAFRYATRDTVVVHADIASNPVAETDGQET
jgi:hypothetical protein